MRDTSSYEIVGGQTLIDCSKAETEELFRT